jgi:hypothetical protein
MIMARGGLFFGCGVVAALAAGWLGFPRVAYERQAAPAVFHHKRHAAESGSGDCTTCHSLRADGSFTGLPAADTCTTCHADGRGKTVWLSDARQPANVRFSHAIHTSRAGLACKTCHGTQGETDEVRVYRVDRISGYSHGTMSMSDCENCHRAHGFEVACLGCHE